MRANQPLLLRQFLSFAELVGPCISAFLSFTFSLAALGTGKPPRLVNFGLDCRQIPRFQRFVVVAHAYLRSQFRFLASSSYSSHGNCFAGQGGTRNHRFWETDLPIELLPRPVHRNGPAVFAARNQHQLD